MPAIALSVLAVAGLLVMDEDPEIDCGQPPATLCLDAKEAANDKLSPDELAKAANEAGEKLGLPPLGFGMHGNSESGTLSDEIVLGEGSAQRRIQIDLHDPMRGVGKDNTFGAIHLDSESSTEEVEHWTIQIWPETATSLNSLYSPIDGPNGTAALVDILMHELMHLCLDPGEGDVDESDPHSCEHFVIDHNLAMKLCDCVDMCRARRSELQSWFEECENEADPDIIDRIGFEELCINDKIEALCARIKQKEDRWNDEEGSESANECSQGGLNGVVDGNACGLLAPVVPVGGWDSSAEPPRSPIDGCPGCE